MVLVEDEVREWEQVVEQGGGEILEGELLHEAVKTLEMKVTSSSYVFSDVNHLLCKCNGRMRKA